MKFFQGFLHFNIRCAEEDLPAIEKFYGDVLDLKSGARPNFIDRKSTRLNSSHG